MELMSLLCVSGPFIELFFWIGGVFGEEERVL